MPQSSVANIVSKRSQTFPTTRYQGSKRQLIDPIWDIVSDLEFDSVLDLFGGTGILSYRAKKHGKAVYYNDLLKFNHLIGKAIIENHSAGLSESDIDRLTTFEESVEYPSFIQDKFSGIYFTNEENEWLDKFRYNIQEKLDNEYKRAISFSAVSQSCLAKRPYNLFHRANLDMRTRDVNRSFGNKTTWERPFEEHFRNFVEEYNFASFSNDNQTRAYNHNALEWKNPPESDLVYIDPPYYDGEQSRMTDYILYYHFLDGYIHYDQWPGIIDESVKTKAIKRNREPWNNPQKIMSAFKTLFERYSDRIIVMSYNTTSAPNPDQVIEELETYKAEVTKYRLSHQYALSTDSNTDELLIVAQ